MHYCTCLTKSNKHYIYSAWLSSRTKTGASKYRASNIQVYNSVGVCVSLVCAVCVCVCVCVFECVCVWVCACVRLFGVSVSVLVYVYVLCVLCMSGYVSAEITRVRVYITQNINLSLSRRACRWNPDEWRQYWQSCRHALPYTSASSHTLRWWFLFIIFGGGHCTELLDETVTISLTGW